MERRVSQSSRCRRAGPGGPQIGDASVVPTVARAMCIARQMQRATWDGRSQCSSQRSSVQVTLALRENSGSAASLHGGTSASVPSMSPEERCFSFLLWAVSAGGRGRHQNPSHQRKLRVPHLHRATKCLTRQRSARQRSARPVRDSSQPAHCNVWNSECSVLPLSYTSV